MINIATIAVLHLPWDTIKMLIHSFLGIISNGKLSITDSFTLL